MDWGHIVGLLIYIALPMGVGAWLVCRWEGKGKVEIGEEDKGKVDQWYQNRIDV